MHSSVIGNILLLHHIHLLVTFQIIPLFLVCLHASPPVESFWLSNTYIECFSLILFDNVIFVVGITFLVFSYNKCVQLFFNTFPLTLCKLLPLCSMSTQYKYLDITHNKSSVSRSVQWLLCYYTTANKAQPF